MLRILMGRANTVKSARILGEIRKNRSGALLIAPEHSSHKAELDI